MKNNSQFVPTYLYCIRVIRVESDFKLSIKKQAWHFSAYGVPAMNSD